MFARKSLWVLLGVVLLSAVLAISFAPARGQDADADAQDPAQAEDEPQKWSLHDYEDPFPYLQSLRVSPDSRLIYYSQMRELTGVEDMGSYWSKKWCTFVLNTEDGTTRDAAAAIDRSLTAHYDVFDVLFSPDGKYQLVSLWQRTKPMRTLFLVLDAKTQKVIGKIPQPDRGWGCWFGNDKLAISRIIDNNYGYIYIFSPKGRQLAKTRYRGRVLTASTDGKVLAVMGRRHDPTSGVTHSNADVFAFSTETGEVLAYSKRLDRQRPAVAYISPEGKYVAFGRICWSYRDRLTEYELVVAPLTDDVGKKKLRIMRERPILPLAVTDDGHCIVLTRAYGGNMGAIKMLDLDGRSRVLVPFRGTGATIHKDKLYCLVAAGIPYITAFPLETEGEMTGSEDGIED